MVYKILTKIKIFENYLKSKCYMFYIYVNIWIIILLEKLNYFFLNEIKIIYNENNFC